MGVERNKTKFTLLTFCIAKFILKSHALFQFLHSPWRGMLIKDNEGDWGICVAAWKGMVPGRPGTSGNIISD